MSVVSYEFVLSRDPFVVRRKVRWSDCDPAGVVFTGKFVEYVLGFITLLYAEMAGDISSTEWQKSLGVDMPCKGMEFEFHGALWTDDEFDMRCHISEIREHSYDIVVESAHTDGRRIFSARFSPICIRRDERSRVPIPLELLQVLARFFKPTTAPAEGKKHE